METAVTSEQRMRWIRMLTTSLCTGVGAGFNDAAQGANHNHAVCTGIAACAVTFGAFWASSPKSPDKPKKDAGQ